jgi:hypothetical protein
VSTPIKRLASVGSFLALDEQDRALLNEGRFVANAAPRRAAPRRACVASASPFASPQTRSRRRRPYASRRRRRRRRMIHATAITTAAAKRSRAMKRMRISASIPLR